ncbi:MAG: hypothetical protein M1819_002798 [Sarea resinae]|nr:MAG: hypothetical protein M1819_002798 [Sarea resinae]
MSSPTPSPSPSLKAESPAQQQARLRRERRQAKIQAGGADRLAKITSLSGRPAEPAPTPPSAQATSQAASSTPSPPTATTAASADDPEEVDISQHFYQPGSNSASPPQSQISEDQLRQLMLGLDAQTGGAGRGGGWSGAQSNPFLGGRSPGMQQGQGFDESAGAGPGAEEDPMMRMLQQMMGGAAGGGGDGQGGLPPGLAEMMGAMGGGQSQPPPNSYGYLWRVVHALFALALGVYISVTTTFSGSHFSRAESIDAEVGVRFFWVFATAELVLQSTRFFVESGKGPSAGILGGLGAMLPEPYAGYLRVASRYSVIYTTLMADSMVVVFVLGAVAWWKGLAS